MSGPKLTRRVLAGVFMVPAMVLAIAGPGGAAPKAASADLSLTKTDSPDPVAPGAKLTYTIEVKNLGPDSASSVQMHDPLPNQTSFSSIGAPAGWSCTASGESGGVTCAKTTMASGDDATFSLVATVNPSASDGTTITNTASVQSSTSDPTASNNSDSTTTSVKGQADLAVTKSDSPDPVGAGGTLIYTLTVTNKGPNTASGVVLTDTLPAGETFQSDTVPAGWSCSTPAVGGTGKVTCTTSSVPANKSGIIKLAVKVNSTVAAGTVISNTASVSAQTPDGAPGNNTATAKTTVSKGADLSVTKTASSDPVVAGTALTYTIVLTNKGSGTATTVKMTDGIPSTEGFQSVTAPTGWSCTSPSPGGSGTLTCTKTQMLKDEKATFTVQVLVSAATPGGSTIVNTATVSAATTDPVADNDSATVKTLVVRRADLSVTKTGHPHPVRPGHRITYTITVANEGPSDAKRAKIVDFVGHHTVFRRVITPAGWSCSHPTRGDSGTVKCTNIGFSRGDTDVIILVVRVRGNTHAGILVSNTAHVSSPTPDVLRGNNADTVVTKVRHR
jgi:uncharacterized repeat protein (TIGR01451 family)